MGTTIWVIRKARPEESDDFDHSLLFDTIDVLDRLSDELGSRRLSEFFDWSAHAFDTSDEELPSGWAGEREQWFAPDPAIAAALVLLDRLKAGEVRGIDPDDRIGLIDELDDCVSKLAFARSEDDAIQLRVVV